MFKCSISILLSLATSTFAQTEVAHHQPFVAKMKTTYFDDDERPMVLMSQFTRTADGSYARVDETEAYDSERGTKQYLLDAPKRLWTMTDSFTKSVVVDLLESDREFNNLALEPGTCRFLRDGDWKAVNTTEIFGMKVIQVDQVISEKTVLRLWIAPDLECFPLRRSLEVNGVVKTKLEAISLQVGDPAPALFEIPAGYSNVSPMQFEERWRRRFCGRHHYSDDDVRAREQKYQAAKIRGLLK